MTQTYLPVVCYEAKSDNPFEPFFELTGDECKTLSGAKDASQKLFAQTLYAITAYVEDADGNRLWDMEQDAEEK